MRWTRVLTVCVLVAVLSLAGCGGKDGGGSSAGSKAAEETSVFALDTGATTEMKITDAGGGVAVDSTGGKAAVWAPPGAADGATWKVTPITEAPAGVEGIVVPGVYVDVAGTEPAKPCSVGFAIAGPAPTGATVVKYAEDGKSWEVVPSVVTTQGATTLVTAQVDGFSAYGLGDADQARIDAARARGKDVDWTIKVVGTETQENQGWTFTYDLDLFASGGDVAQGGIYKGYATLTVDGKYSENFGGIVQGLGDIKASARDDALTFIIIDEPLADLLTGAPVGDPIIAGAGVMKGKGMGSLNISATGPNASGQVNDDVTGDSPVAFKIEVKGEDVQVEIDNVGIFPGKILRTEK